MIALPSHTQIWIAAGVTDLRRGFAGLSALVQTELEKSPMSGQVFIFRGRRGDLVKLIWFDGDGLCLFQKRLERGRFIWPQATEGSVSLTRHSCRCCWKALIGGARSARGIRSWRCRYAVGFAQIFVLSPV
jgi:transposase